MYNTTGAEFYWHPIKCSINVNKNVISNGSSTHQCSFNKQQQIAIGDFMVSALRKCILFNNVILFE